MRRLQIRLFGPCFSSFLANGDGDELQTLKINIQFFASARYSPTGSWVVESFL
jgi:hypothetical protein